MGGNDLVDFKTKEKEIKYNKMNKFNDMLVYKILFIIIIVLSISISYLLMVNYNLKDNVNSFELYYLNTYKHNFTNQGIWGLSIPEDKVFAVYTKGRTLSSVLTTCIHEYGHTNKLLNENESLNKYIADKEVCLDE